MRGLLAPEKFIAVAEDLVASVPGVEDVFTKIDMCRKHYAACGLGEGFVDQFIR